MDIDKIKQIGINIGFVIFIIWIYPMIIFNTFVRAVIKCFDAFIIIYREMLFMPDLWSSDPIFTFKKNIVEFFLYFAPKLKHTNIYHCAWDDSMLLGVFFISVFLFGITVGPIGIFMLIRYFRAKSWPSVSGIITTSMLHQKYSGRAFSGGRVFVPQIEYEYNVKGKKYTGHKIYMMMFKINVGYLADKITGRYPIGSKHRVYYSPKRPDIALLDNKTLSVTLLVFALPGLLITLFSLLIVGALFFVKYF